MYAVIRIRGLKGVRPEIKHTLDSLNLDRKNHCVIVPLNAEMKGMLQRARDYIAFGPVAPATLAALLEKRGRMPGDKKITAETLKAHKLSSFKDAATSLIENKTTLETLGIKRVFRLNAPRKGFARIGTKQSTELKGPLGFHANGLDALLGKMM